MSFATPFGCGGNAFHLQSQVWVQQSEHEAPSHTEQGAIKKPRVSEFDPNRMMPAVALNRDMKGRFVKTRLCEKFNMGICSYGDKCTYAHGFEEIRRLVPPQCHEVVAKEGHFDRTWNGDSNVHVCRMFHNLGMCSYGDKCRFLHDDPKKLHGDSTWLREGSDTSTPKGHHRNGSGPFECHTSGNSTFNAMHLNPKPLIHKTRLCNKWQMTGGCRFGKTCVFAHGHAELHNSGYHTEAESKNASSNTVAGLRFGRPSSAVLVTPVSEHVTGAKCCIFNWKVLGKINGIYADWIDDVPAAMHA